MKIAVIGAGAIGGLVGARLALAGEEVTFIVRGANLEAIGARGIKLIEMDGEEKVAAQVRATDDYDSAGVQDLVILALKAHQVDGVSAQIGKLFGPQTVVVTMQNGIPFWYFHRHGGEFDGRTVHSVDAGGELARRIPPARVLGCVVYPAAELVAPGVIRHIEGARFPLGELDGTASERVNAVSACFQNAGFKSPVLDNIRAEIWLKLWGNVSFNPISALAAEMMREAEAVATKLGISFRVTLDRRIEGAALIGKHKTSMLQDVEAGRGPEIDALVGSVIELARMTGTPTPHIDSAYALVKLLEQTMSEERGGVKLQKLVTT